MAALLLATNAQHAIWGAAGLENSLFSFLLALGTLRVLVETESGGFPWTAPAFLGLALTRPEGAIYATIAFVVAGLADLRARRYHRILGSLALFLVPFATYHGFRYSYFALPFPTTYYAKVAAVDFDLFAWNARSWTYLRKWATDLGWIWFVPVFLAGAIRTESWRVRLVIGWTALLGLAVWVPGGPLWIHARIWLWIATAGALPLLAWRTPETAGRSLCSAFAMITFAFAVRANGDWMSGYRWMALLAVPLATIFAAGIAEIAERVPDRMAEFVPLLALLPVGVNIKYTMDYADHPEANPASVQVRLNYQRELAARLHLDRPWVSVDQHMGGMMWWGPPSATVIDAYGLTDVGFALHRDVPGFRVPYLLDPPRFDFAHSTEDKGTLVGEPAFRRAFVEVPPYRGPNGKPHGGNWVNRTLLALPEWPGKHQILQFDAGPRIEGFVVRSPDVSANGGLYLELGLTKGSGPFRVFVILSGPATAVFDAPPGYDDLFPSESWRTDEVFIGRYALKLPADLPIGTYDLGFVVIGDDGTVRAATHVPEGARIATDDAVFAKGEVRFAAVVHVVTHEAAKAAGEADWSRAKSRAEAADCAGAEESWRDALEHVPRSGEWATELAERASGPLSNCWAGAASRETDLVAQIEDLRRGRRWDVESEAVRSVGAAIADARWPEAEQARRAGDLRQTLNLFEAIVAADPTRSWARRYAEDARTLLLARQVRPSSR